MDPNSFPSSAPKPQRVQLPSIKNLLVETQRPQPPAYRSLQVTPEFAPLPQRRTNEDSPYTTRPLHASPSAPPPRFPNAASSAQREQFRQHETTHSHQLPSHQNSPANDVNRATASRIPVSGATVQLPMRSHQDRFRERSSTLSSPTPVPSSASIEARPHSGSPESTTTAPFDRGHGHRQGHHQSQGAYALSSDTQPRRYADTSTSAYPSPPDPAGGSHSTMHDLHSLSPSESQSRHGRQSQRSIAESLAPYRDPEGFGEYGRPTPTVWGSVSPYSHAHGQEWDAVNNRATARDHVKNGHTSRRPEAYDSVVADRAKGLQPQSADPSYSSQRGPLLRYRRREQASYPSRPQHDDVHHREHSYVPENDYQGTSARAPYSPENFAAKQSTSPHGHGNSAGYASTSRGRHSTENEDRHAASGTDHAYVGRGQFSVEDGQAARSGQRHRPEENEHLYPQRQTRRAHEEQFSGPSPPLPVMNDHLHGHSSSSHPPRPDLTRRLEELTNEARVATQEGRAMKKIHEFSNALAQFANFARQHPPVARPEDVQEMSHRAELIYRMARELKRWKKAAMARAAAAAPVEQAQAPKAQPSKKKVMTKEEKRNLIDLEKIKKKRASAQQGIKSKYTKRNKKTQPPKKCSSCGIKDTPEWRKGPEGPRSLCNACGLHYAKLMRNRATNEGKWIGPGLQPPIDIITLRQVTGVGIQPQQAGPNEYEIPGIFAHIPAALVQTGKRVKRPSPPSVSPPMQPVASTSSSMPNVSTRDGTVATTMATGSESGFQARLGDSEPQEVGIEEVSPDASPDDKGKKRKAEGVDGDDDAIQEDGDEPPTKRRRVSSLPKQDMQMQPSSSVESLAVTAGSSQAPLTNDSIGENSF